MLIEVIPYDASFGTETLTYFVGDSFRSQIKIWQLIKIPYGKKQIYGIIAYIHEEKSINITPEIKEVIDIIHPHPLLAEYQIPLLMKIAQKYALAIHRVLGISLPKPLLNRLEKYNFPIFPTIQNQTFSNHEIFLSQHDIITAEKILPFLKPNIIIILPDDIMLHIWREKLQNHKDIFFLPHEATDTRRMQSWIDIVNKKFPIVIGTRRLLWYNLSAYTEIWYIEDGFSQTYFHYPIEIENIDLLAHLANSEKFSIKIFTSIPQLKTLSYFHYFTLHHI